MNTYANSCIEKNVPALYCNLMLRLNYGVYSDLRAQRERRQTTGYTLYDLVVRLRQMSKKR